MRFTFLLRYTEGRGLGAVPHTASGEFLGEGEDSLMFILRPYSKALRFSTKGYRVGKQSLHLTSDLVGKGR